MSKLKNVTFIDDLFDADSLMAGPEYISQGNQERDAYTNQVRNRHIRTHDKDLSIAMNGGMIQAPMQMQPREFPNQPYFQQQNNFQIEEEPEFHRSPHHSRHYSHYQHEISCMTVANHIKDCPILSLIHISEPTRPY